ncbi:tRNA (adenosine(37)-N6)-threonylcarbamoyltransferase complex ATPase subunit type 1 TsaE [Bacteroidia bacterium]|nr:tRNA (adenosine(37)-N6)-threonylcarbamoyltransferase complex ATPase subunit type 1 TsaE [Bacteroidia bacterium]
MKWTIENIESIDKVAKDFLASTKEKRIFALYGAMGVGKTTFVKAIAKQLGVTEDVNSPTFSIVNEYKTASGESVYHFDCYRLNSVSEALDFGCEEYLFSGCKCFVEWPEKLETLLSADLDGILACYISETEDGGREIEIR